ncbi:MAG: hypothetical protein WC412_06285 [Candidatus Omnitrophota bacterium]|jgi:hypothetical protein
MNKNQKLLKQLVIFLNILIIFFVSFSPILGFCKNIAERFQGKNDIVYDVFYNGIYTGKITWKYLGKERVGNKETEVIYLDSDTKIFNLLNIASKEKVFLEAGTYLPVRAERDVILFGKQEDIKEIYDQEKGSVIITNSNPKKKEFVLHQAKPIHNILALLYFFPQDIPLIKGKNLYFNLPTQKVTVKLISEGTLVFGKEKKEFYLLSGSGAKRFNLWLDKKDRSPLKMEFLSIAGKVTIVRKSGWSGATPS